MKGNELIDRIRDEMAAAKNGYIGVLGELMTEYLRLHPEAETSEGKSLQGAYSALRSAAQKKQQGGCYMMLPREAFEGLMGYYGFPHAPSDFRACCGALMGDGNPSDLPAANRQEPGRDAALADEFDLDALLEVENPKGFSSRFATADGRIKDSSAAPAVPGLPETHGAGGAWEGRAIPQSARCADSSLCTREPRGNEEAEQIQCEAHGIRRTCV